MYWCWLIGHRFKLIEAGGHLFKTCRCKKSYMFVETVELGTGSIKDAYWKPLDDLVKGKKS